MTLNRVNVILCIVMALVIGLLVLFRVDHSQPNYQVMLADDMTYSPAYTAFEPNENFANGRTLQEPVPGTIARGMEMFHFAATPDDALRAGEELGNPHDLNSEDGLTSADRGAEAFRVFCTACHGADGAGNGPVAMRGFPPPPSLLTGKSREMKDGQLFHILTLGQNTMPNFAAQLSPSRRWDVINYIRRLQIDAAKSSPEEQPNVTAPAEDRSAETTDGAETEAKEPSPLRPDSPLAVPTEPAENPPDSTESQVNETESTP